MTLPAVVHFREIAGQEWRIHMLATNHFEISHDRTFIEVSATHDNWPNPPHKKWRTLENAMKWLDKEEKAGKRMRKETE